MASERERRLATERIRVLFRSFSSREYILGFPLLSAGVVAFVAYEPTNFWPAIFWVSLVGIIDFGHLLFERRFRREAPADHRLALWGYGKAAFTTLNGLSWSVGVILLHVPHSTIATLAPAWGIMLVVTAAIYGSAAYKPCLFGVMMGAIVPAATWLWLNGSGFDVPIAICMAASLPFVCLLGVFAARNIDVMIINRLEIASLLENQTRQTQLLKIADGERTQFFSAASHDLRQPLHALGLYVSLLRRTDSDESRLEIVERIADCSTNLDRLFNAILGVAETNVAVEAAALRPTRLQDVLDRVVTSFRPEAKLKSLDMRVVPTRLWAEIAPAILERIMSNLVSNAIKYTPAGVVLLGVRRRGEFAEVLVADTGLGIAEQDLPFIFKDFFQIANPERNRDKGFGLGLGIVRRLSEGMNWSLLVTSKVGRGTTIGVRVPIASDDSGTGVEIRNDIVPCDLRSSTAWVLVLDDDPLVRDAMERLLTDWGRKVALCQTGAEAVAVLHASGPERTWHILLDYRLAGDETGLEIADRVRAEFGNRVQVTIMSGETNQELIQATKLRGLTLLRKPVKPIRLRATLTAS